MKDFDETRAERAAADRQFRIGGETFTRKAGVRPEDLLEYENLSSTTDLTETMRVIDDLVVSLLEPGDDAEARYRALRERTDDPVTIEDLQEVVAWIIEEMTGRTPTQPPSPSTGGRARTGTRSTAASSSRDAKEGQPT